MSSGIIPIIKRAALEAMRNEQLCDLRFGTVISVSPLKVQVTNQFILPESVLIVPEHLTDHQVPVSFDWDTSMEVETETASEEVPNHSHTITSNKTKKMTIHNTLKSGDKVALLRKTGGQTFYILDRI